MAIIAAAACSFKEDYVIHFVNYRGRTDVDKGFEDTLKKQKVKYKIVYHNADRRPEAFPKIVRNIKSAKKVDLVVTWGTTASREVFGTYDSNDNEKFIKDKNGVFTLVTDPYNSQLVSTNEAIPRRITGAWYVAPFSSQFSAMMVYRPGKKIGVLYTPTENNGRISAELMVDLGKQFNVEVIAIPFDQLNGIPISTNAKEALRRMKDEGCEWLYLPPDTYLGTQAEKLVIPTAHELGLITFASNERLMNLGAAFGLVAPYFEVGQLAGEQAYQILVKKTPPHKIPIIPAKRFQHQMNSTALKQLKLNISPTLLADITDVAAK